MLSVTRMRIGEVLALRAQNLDFYFKLIRFAVSPLGREEHAMRETEVKSEIPGIMPRYPGSKK